MKKKTKKYHTVRTVPKQRNTTLSEQFQNKEIPHCQNSSKTKKYHTVRTVISLFFSSFYDKRAQITHAIFRHPLSNNLFNSELLFLYPKISLLLIIMLHREYKHNTVRLQYNVTINKV
jgi:hypothetical protein